MVPLLDVQRMHAPIRAELEAAVLDVVSSGKYILGPWVPKLEAALAAYLGVARAAGVSNGTDAIVMAVQASGKPAGMEWICPTYTFVASGDAIVRAGGVPRFVDVNPETMLMDPDAVGSAIGPNTAGIIAVHLFGQCCDLDALVSLARRHDLVLIEDNAQAMGAEWHGRKAGSIGRFGCFSFFPSKNLGGLGDGGLVTATDDADAALLLSIRAHGSAVKYLHERIGGNYRLDSIQAAALLVKLPLLDQWNAQRREVAAIYDRLLVERGLVQSGQVRPAGFQQGSTHVYHQYVVFAHRRDALAASLNARGIGNAVYYPVPLHLQRCFEYLSYAKGSLPASEQAAAEALALPIFPGLSLAEQEEVVGAMTDFYGK